MSVPHSPSPIPMARSASKTPPHIMTKYDMIRSYSPTPSASALLSVASLTPMPSASLTPIPSASALHMPMPSALHNHIMVSYLQGICVVGVFVFFMLMLRPRPLTKAKKQKMEGFSIHDGFNIHDYPQQINPTAYNTLNLIRRGSSNNLGNVSPV